MLNSQNLTLSDVTELIVDSEHKTAPISEAGYPYIRTPNIGRGFFILDGVRRVSEKSYKKWTRRAIPQYGDLILCREAPVGNLAMVPKNLQPCLGQRTVLIRPTKTKVDPLYLQYLLLGDEIQGLMHGKSTGSTVAHLNMSDIRSMPLPALPPLHVQQKIAAVLSAYDDLIENNTRRIAILEEMAQRIYREWFVHFRYPGHEAVPLVEVDGVTRPEGWEVVRLDSLYKTSSGGTPSRKKSEYYDGGNVPWLKTKELNDLFIIGTEEKITDLGVKKSSAKLFEKNTVIMAMYGVTIGQLGILSIDSTTNQACCAFLPKQSPFDHNFLYLWLKENRNYILSLKMGAAQQNISQKIIQGLEFLKPSDVVVDQFTGISKPVLMQIENLQRKNENLRKQRDLLLPKLISGQLDVSGLDIALPDPA